MKFIIYTGVIFAPDRNAAAQRANAFAAMIERSGYIPVIIGMDERLPENTDILSTRASFGSGMYYVSRYPAGATEWLRRITDVSDIVKVIEHLKPQNIKAVIAMDFFSVALLRLMRYCRKKRISLVVDTVDWFQKSKYPFPRNFVKDFDTCLRMNYVHKRADRMITISRYLYDYYKKNVQKIVMIPGIVNGTFNDAQYDPQSQLSIAFVGSPGPKCDKEKIDWLIKIVCGINTHGNRVKFYIAGVDKNTLLTNRPDLAVFEQFDESVVCMGRISHSDCIDLIRKCDFATIIREDTLLSKAGFPTKLGEAFQCGTPVIVTPTSNISEYIPPTHGIVTGSCTYQATEDAILQALELSAAKKKKMHDEVSAYNPLDASAFVQLFNSVIEE